MTAPGATTPSQGDARASTLSDRLLHQYGANIAAATPKDPAPRAALAALAYVCRSIGVTDLAGSDGAPIQTLPPSWTSADVSVVRRCFVSAPDANSDDTTPARRVWEVAVTVLRGYLVVAVAPVTDAPGAFAHAEVLPIPASADRTMQGWERWYTNDWAQSSPDPKSSHRAVHSASAGEARGPLREGTHEFEAAQHPLSAGKAPTQRPAGAVDWQSLSSAEQQRYGEPDLVPAGHFPNATIGRERLATGGMVFGPNNPFFRSDAAAALGRFDPLRPTPGSGVPRPQTNIEPGRVFPGEPDADHARPFDNNAAPSRRGFNYAW